MVVGIMGAMGTAMTEEIVEGVDYRAWRVVLEG
jgi:hypothetical protein